MRSPFPAEEAPLLFLPGGFGKASFLLENGWFAHYPVGFLRCSGCAGPWKAGVFMAGCGAVPQDLAAEMQQPLGSAPPAPCLGTILDPHDPTRISPVGVQLHFWGQT